MHYQELDEDGLASSYLMLTALSPIGIYYIYEMLKKKRGLDCKCKYCTKLKRQSKSVSYFSSLFLQSIFWIIVSYLIKNIMTIQIKKRSIGFDPYLILNVTKDSTIQEIKKSFRKIVKTYKKSMGDSNTNDTNEEELKNINKAFELLQNPENLTS